MSNVLIGIIGVILFIGLALAGALFLGPRFQESTNNSKAAAAVQATAQVSNAANLYGSVQGARIDPLDGVPELVSTGYLKLMPSNPVNASAEPYIAGAIGTRLAGVVPAFVFMSLGTEADNVCTAIVRQTGQNPNATTSPVSSAANFGFLPNAGCFKKGTGAPAPAVMPVNEYYVFSRI